MSKFVKVFLISFLFLFSTESIFAGRYYDSETGRWLSVDPMADKYPGLSPYNYVENNPLRFIDPNGESGVDALDAMYANYDDLSPEGQKAFGDTFVSIGYAGLMLFLAVAKAPIPIPAPGSDDPSEDNGTGKDGNNEDNQDSKESVYDQEADRNEQGRPQADPNAKGPHSRLSTRKGEKQGHQFNSDGQLDYEISPHDKRHGPHKHKYDNSDPKNPIRGEDHIPLKTNKENEK